MTNGGRWIFFIAIITIGVISLTLSFQTAQGVIGEILITEGAEKSFCDQVSANLTGVINALETKDLSNVRAFFTDEGYSLASDVLQRVPMENARRTHRTHLLRLPRGGWEVRDIKVSVEMGETANNKEPVAANPNQFLVFELSPDGLIRDMRFAMESAHCKRILEEGEKLNDFARRQQILQTVEIFRTAYCRKDTAYLKQIYSDDALILVGRVLKPRKDVPDMFKTSRLSPKKIEFLRLSKKQYIERLDSLFERNAFVKVIFDSVDISCNDKDPYLYSVTLKQNWYSSTYSDTGWVFLLWDFKDEENPTIYVRSWQPEPFEDGSILNQFEFVVVRGNE